MNEQCAVLFAGQGSQFPSMGAALLEDNPKAREVFDLGSAVCGVDLKALCCDTDMETLSKTENAQLAIFALSMAQLAALDADVTAVAGFSLGEFSALTAAGVLSLSDGFLAVQQRGLLMGRAAAAAPGAMYAVLGLADEALEEICSEIDGYVLPVNYNCPGQLVIAGDTDAAAKAAALAVERGARKAVPLAVSGAFHTRLMEPAAEQLSAFLKTLTWQKPRLPIYTNVTGKQLGDFDLAAHLYAHMVSPVRFHAMLLAMEADGNTNFVELGSGKTLCGFAKRISKSISCRAFE